jgi:hypothetical protein
VSLSPSLCFSDLLLRSPNNSFKQFGFNSAHLLEVHFCSCKDYLALPVNAVINFSRSELQLEREVEREREIDPDRASEELPQRKKTTSFAAAAVCADCLPARG